MKERPIIFSTQMVLAILAWRKTMTRRTVKWPAIPDWHDQDHAAYATYKGKPIFRLYDQGGLNSEKIIPCPYGMVGDRLWVREAFLPQECVCQSAPAAERGPCLRCGGGGNTAVYKADATCSRDKVCCGYKSPIHMPRWASRITLEIVGVRVERLQEISEEDIRSEGVVMSPLHVGIDMSGNAIESENAHLDPWDYFIDLWQSIHGRDSWAANPWVWAILFKVVTPARAGG